MTGSDVSHVTGSDRKYVLRMPGFFPRAFFLTRVVQVPWLPEVTAALLLPLYMYIHCFSELRIIILEKVFFARDYASRDQIYHFIHLTVRLFSTPTVRTWT